MLLVVAALTRSKREFRDEPVAGGVWGQRVTVPVLVACPTITEEMEKEKPDLYQNIYVVERLVGTEHPIRHEWEVAKNNIGEADCALVFYEKWFSADDRSTCVVRTGDGDAFSLLLLHSFERLVAGKFHNKMYLWMPCTDAKSRSEGVTRECKPLAVPIFADAKKGSTLTVSSNASATTCNSALLVCRIPLSALSL